MLDRRLFLGLASLALAGCTASPAPAASPTPADATPTPSPTPTPTPTPSASDPLPPGPVNALFLGTDTWEPGSTRGRTDAIVLGQLAADRNHLTLVSVPRDAWVSLPGGESKINAAFDRGGATATRDAVATVFGGVPIPYVAQTNFDGYVNIVKALGHLEVDNPIESTFIDPTDGHPSHFPKGRITLSPDDWMVFARQRKELPRGDLDRAYRHRAILMGMLRRIREVVAHEPDTLAALAATVAERVHFTGIDPLQAALAAPLAGRLDADGVTTLLAPTAGFGTRGGQSVVLLDAARCAELGAALRAGDVSGYVARYGQDRPGR